MEQTTINVFGTAYTVGQFIGLLVLAYYIVSAVIVLFEESVILSRHGESGWKVLIPFYGPYLFFKKTCDNGGLYWATVISAVIAGLLYLVVPVMGEYYLLMPLFCRLLLCVNLADEENRGTGFAFGMLFLAPVFFGILAFGKKAEPAAPDASIAVA